MSPEKKNPGASYDIDGICQLIPHRYPFLMIDALKDVIPGERALGIKNVTINEPFFPGHFPDQPIMPGVLIVEAMAQTAAACVMSLASQRSEDGHSIVYFTAIDHVRFRHPVRPGDRLYIDARQKQRRGDYWKFAAEVRIEDRTVAAQASFSAKIIKDER